MPKDTDYWLRYINKNQKKLKDVLSKISIYKDKIDGEICTYEQIDIVYRDWAHLYSKLDYYDQKFYKPYWIPLCCNNYGYFIDPKKRMSVFEMKYIFIRPYLWYKIKMFSGNRFVHNYEKINERHSKWLIFKRRIQKFILKFNIDIYKKTTFLYSHNCKGFIVPNDGKMAIAEIENKNIIIKNKLNIKSDIIYNYRNSNLIYLENNNLIICNINKDYSSQTLYKKRLPKKFSAKSLYQYKSSVFVGGQRKYNSIWKSKNYEILYQFNVIDKKLKKIDFPIRIAGKSIDDLLVTNNKLIALDNVISPKLLIQYPLTREKINPKQHKVLQLPVVLTHEHCVKMLETNYYFVVLSHTISQYGGSSVVRILNKKNIKDFYIIFSKEERITSILTIDDRLLVATQINVYQIKLHRTFLFENLYRSGNINEQTKIIHSNEKEIKFIYLSKTDNISIIITDIEYNSFIYKY